MSSDVKIEIRRGEGGLLFLEDKFDPAILGVLMIPGRPATACYDVDKIVQILHAEGLSAEDATDYVNLRIIGFLSGPDTPGFVKPVRKPGDLDGANFPRAEGT